MSAAAVADGNREGKGGKRKRKGETHEALGKLGLGLLEYEAEGERGNAKLFVSGGEELSHVMLEDRNVVLE